MVKKKFLAALLAAAVMVTTVTDAVIPASEAQAAETAPQEIILDRTESDSLKFPEWRRSVGRGPICDGGGRYCLSLYGARYSH